MELIYPSIIYIVLFLVICCVIFIKKRSKELYLTGKKVANTQFLKESPYFKQVIKRYKLYTFLLKIICLCSVLICAILVARPARVETKDEKMYSRDVFLCMDVSSSVDELNKELITTLKQTVESLNEERFGISIFNTSSVILVPLTDDYDYVLDTLDTVKKSIQINSGEISSTSVDNYTYLSQYTRKGTLIDNETRGSSLIGDGLASCIYNFPQLEENRTRAIIFTTDNDLQGEEMITLQEAAEIAKEKNITVYGICPRETKEEDKEKLKIAMEITGGYLYEQGEENNVKEIVENIEQKEKSLVENKKQTKKVDIPEVPIIVLVIIIFILFFIDKRGKI